jgi:hypothetical protein
MALSRWTGLVQSSGPIRIGEQDAGKTIELKTGDTLLVSLDGNITTAVSTAVPLALKKCTPVTNLIFA